MTARTVLCFLLLSACSSRGPAGAPVGVSPIADPAVGDGVSPIADPAAGAEAGPLAAGSGAAGDMPVAGDGSFTGGVGGVGGSGGATGGSGGTGGSTGGVGGAGGATGGAGGAGGTGTGGVGGTTGGSPAECAEDADCDDGNPCTTETCSAGDCTMGTEPQWSGCGPDSQCDGDTCVPVGGHQEQCRGGTQCDGTAYTLNNGGFFCQDGYCEFEYACGQDVSPDFAPCCAGSTCKDSWLYCGAGDRCAACGDKDEPCCGGVGGNCRDGFACNPGGTCECGAAWGQPCCVGAGGVKSCGPGLRCERPCQANEICEWTCTY